MEVTPSIQYAEQVPTEVQTAGDYVELFDVSVNRTVLRWIQFFNMFMSFFSARACAHVPAFARACSLVLRLCPSSFSAPELLSFAQDWLTFPVSLAQKPGVENGP